MVTSLLFSRTPKNDGGDVTEHTVTDYTTDLSEMADEIRSAIVTVSSRGNGVTHTVSGVIYAQTEDGVMIFTSEQALAEASEIEVIFDSGTAVQAELVGSDSDCGCALLKVSPDFAVTVFRSGNSDLLAQGEYIVAMGGRIPAVGSASISFGIVSEPGQRKLSSSSSWAASIIETDAAVTSDMLGGALMNIGGELTGMLVAKAPVNSDRMSYALSVNEMKNIYSELMAEGTVVRGSLNITGRSLSSMRSYEKNERNIPLSQTTGVLITHVEDLSEEGLKEGDIIISVAGAAVADESALRTLMYTYSPGDTVSMTVIRDGESVEESIQLQ